MRRKPTTCVHCDILLTNTNWTLRRKYRDYRCDNCIRAYKRQWDKTPAGRAVKKRHVLWVRKNYIGVRQSADKHFYIRVENKRDHTGFCEMCEKLPKRLVYHHWDETDFSQGIWVCQSCHNLAHGVEKGLTDKYLNLKRCLSRKKA